MTETIDRDRFVEYGRQGAQKRWAAETVKMSEISPDLRPVVRALVRLSRERAQKAATR